MAEPRVVTYRDEFAGSFATLNYEWIERYFSVEDEDVKALENPRGKILDPGGEIFFVLVDREVVGTAAMMLHAEPGVFELAKMAVRPDFQGRGLSNLLMDACIGFARDAGAREVLLLTNDALIPAVSLYRAHGFVVVDGYSDARYARGNLEMRLALTTPRG